MPDDYYSDPEAYDSERGDDPIRRDDIPFYVGLAKEAAAAGHAVLELACGTGRVTIAIAEAGLPIVGLDASPAMLGRARHKTEGRDNPRWVDGDMRDFRLDERFGLVIIPFRSFLHLLTVADQKACLAHIREHLAEGGRLALNVFNPDLAVISGWQTAKRDLWERRPASDHKREHWFTRQYSSAVQQLDEVRQDVALSDDAAIISRVQRNLRLRYVFRYEMEHLLALSGFEVESLYGWFDRRPFTDESTEMVWLARAASDRPHLSS
ncbi:MAG TPA: class I SAM-dependent methyltransferase [Dehalococcoidia bacterium]